MQTVQEIYQNVILPLPENEQLKLASLILKEVTQTRGVNQAFGEDKQFVETQPKKTGSIRELFGSASLGQATGADNESIDRDLS